MPVGCAADLIALREVGAAAALRGGAMAPGAAFQKQLPASGDGVGLAGHGVLQIFLFVRSLSKQERHTEEAKQKGTHEGCHFCRKKFPTNIASIPDE